MKFACVLFALLGIIQGTGAANYKCHGDITQVSCSGASAQTARPDRLSGGVQASQAMLNTDYQELSKRKHCYLQAGARYCIQPSVVAAIASRESRGGKVLYRTNGYGDGGRAYGIMQCDGGASGLGSRCTQYPWDSCEAISFVVGAVLKPNIATIRRKHNWWTASMALKGGISAYNAGTGNVRTYSGMDIGTTGNDYANDVCARAQYLIRRYGWP